MLFLKLNFSLLLTGSFLTVTDDEEVEDDEDAYHNEDEEEFMRRCQ